MSFPDTREAAELCDQARVPAAWVEKLAAAGNSSASAEQNWQLQNPVRLREAGPEQSINLRADRE
jgi:hypothetical protein